MTRNLHNSDYSPVVVLGLCPTGLAVVRSLGREGIPVFGVDSSYYAISLFSRYCKKLVILNPRKDEEKLVKCLVKFALTVKHKPVLFATSDDFLIFIANNNNELSRYFIYPSINNEIADKFLDKEQFYKICNDVQIDYPKVYCPANMEDLRAISSIVRYPCIIKPIRTHEWAKTFKVKKAFKINSKEEMMQTMLKIQGTALEKNILIQELVEGPDNKIYFFAAYFDNKSNPLGYCTGRKIRQFPPEFGTTASAESLYVPEIIDKSINLLQRIEYHGLCDVEFKYDDKDHKFKIIEINPRPGRWYGLVEGAKVNLISRAYFDLTGLKMGQIDVQIDGLKWIFVWRDIISAFYYLRLKQLTFRNYFRSLKGKKIYAIYASDDALPFFVFPFTLFVEIINVSLKKVFKNLSK